MPSKYKPVTEVSLKRIRACSRGKRSFAELFPEKRATRCLHPGAESLGLNEVSPGCKLYFEWICEKNPDHVWPSTVNNRSRYGCPHCYNEQRAEKVRAGKTKPENLLKVRFPEYYAQLIRVYDRNGKAIAQETVAAKSGATGVWDTGCGHGPFEMPIKDRTQPGASFGCSKCANVAAGERPRAAALKTRGALRETHPTLASEWLALDDPHTQRLDITPDTCPPTSAFRVWWQCSEPLPTGKPCSRRYPATIADRTNGRHGCPVCANRNARGQKKRTSAISRSGSVCEHPVLGAEFRGILKPGKQHLTSSDISTQSNYLCLWECSLHPGEEIKASPTSRLRLIDGEAYITGCTVCSVEKRREWGYTQSLATTGCLASTHPQLAANWLACVDHPEQTPLNTSAGSKLNVLWQCSQNSDHPPWPATVMNRVNGSGCPRCSSSKGELEVSRALTALNIQFLEQLYVSQLTKLCGVQKSKVSGQMRYDFAIIGESYEIHALIEYHGIQHYEPVNFYQSLRTEREVHEAFERGLQRDQDKVHLANDMGIPLLVIPYWSYHDIESILTAFIVDLGDL